MTDKYFAKAIKEAIKTAQKDSSFEWPEKFTIVDIRYRSEEMIARAKHPVYDVLIRHEPDSKSYDISAYEVHIYNDGQIVAMYNGGGYWFKHDGRVSLCNQCISYAYFTKEMANDWLRQIESRLNDKGCA